MNRLLLPLLWISLAGCYSIPDIEGFQPESWKEKGCGNDLRIYQVEALIDQQEKLLGEGQSEIRSLLGQPDEHELYRRNQKFFFYDLSGSDCPESSNQRLSIKFDALDRVKEVMVITAESKGNQ